MNRYTQAWLADLPHGFAPISDDRLRELINEARRAGGITLLHALNELQLRRDASAANALFADCTCDGAHICNACQQLK